MELFVLSAESLTAKRVRAEQDEPYGDILIFPGLNYEEQRQTLWCVHNHWKDIFDVTIFIRDCI